MRKEIDKAVEMFHNIAFGTGKNGCQMISDRQLASFVTVLTELLVVRCEKNWYPDKPVRGSGNRCLRMNFQNVDSTIVESLKKSLIPIKEVRTKELTIWVDPGVVSIRIGEEGSIGTEMVEPEAGDYSSPKRFRLESSEDEAYSSSDSSSPIPSSPSIVTQPIRNNVGQIPSSAQRGFIPRLNTSPSTKPHSHAQDIMAAGANIPATMAPFGQYTRPRTLFPDMESRPVAVAPQYKAYSDIAMYQSRQVAMAAHQMPRMVPRGNYLDISAQA